MKQMQFMKYLMDKNYNQISKDVDEPLWLDVTGFFSKMSLVCLSIYMAWEAIFNFELGPFLFMSLGVMVNAAVVQALWLKSNYMKDYNKTWDEISKELFENPAMLRGFISECVERAREGLVDKQFMKPDYYKELIESLEARNEKAFNMYLSSYLSDCTLLIFPDYKKQWDTAVFEEYLKNGESVDNASDNTIDNGSRAQSDDLKLDMIDRLAMPTIEKPKEVVNINGKINGVVNLELKNSTPNSSVYLYHK